MLDIRRLSPSECAALAEFPGWIAYFYEVVKPPEQTTIYTTGLCHGHVELRDALVMVGRSDMLKQVAVHRKLPARERLDFWGNLARELRVPILLLDEKPEGEDSFSIIPLYKVYPNGSAELFLDGKVLRQQLAYT